MPRWFNIAGPCKADKHYMLSATSRLPDLETLIEQESYMVDGIIPTDRANFLMTYGISESEFDEISKKGCQRKL